MPFNDPPRRRWWLLTKALEAHPLSEALPLAQSAEEFLHGDQTRNRTPVTQASAAANSACADQPNAVGVGTRVSMATVDEVVAYLSKQGDVVIRQKNGLFLVNDRTLENLGQLLARANGYRERGGLPVFLLGSPTSVLFFP